LLGSIVLKPSSHHSLFISENTGDMPSWVPNSSWIDELQRRIASLEQDKRDLKNECRELRDEVRWLDREKRELEDEQLDLEDETRRLKKYCRILEDKC